MDTSQIVDKIINVWHKSFKYGNSSVIQHELGILGADRSNGDLHKAILRWAVIKKK